ncbi:MAG: 50S ribosomal protein L10 [Caldilineaceae bacterium]|nr:50S ribosomal protein L10 [Caldilineaceae bacterium]
MAITRAKKEELVALYKENIENASALVLTEQNGATVAQITSLRARLRSTGTTYMVTKNTLFDLALKEAGREVDVSSVLEGPVAVAFIGEDIGKGVKSLNDWIRENGGEVVKVKNAILQNEVLNAAQAAQLSELPTREEMLAKLLGTIIAPASKLVRVINEPGASLARVLKAHAEPQEDAA